MSLYSILAEQPVTKIFTNSGPQYFMAFSVIIVARVHVLDYFILLIILISYFAWSCGCRVAT